MTPSVVGSTRFLEWEEEPREAGERGDMASTAGGQVSNRMRRARWRLKLLGGVELHGPQGRIPLEGRIAAALAYVAWSAPTPKAQLAGLLWPDTEPVQERNNLRQLLRRLRLACGGEPVLQSVGQQDALVLDEDVDCDLLRLREAAHRGHSEEVLQLQGLLLAGLDFDELPELARWLEGARLAAEGWFRKLIALELKRREDAGDLLGAIWVAETWLSLEPESEPIAQSLMQLHHAVGNRHAALHVYEQLKARLDEELGVTPQPETVVLARRIARSLQQERSAALKPAPPPLELRRPWLRVGREAEWAQLQEGWAQRPVLCLVGAPGVGKSRLALDFAASQGDFLLLAGHPADPGTPWATVTRALRQLLAAQPDTALSTWVKGELSQLLPELAPPRRLRRRSARTFLVRLHRALAEALACLSQGAASLVLDDLQVWDAESLAFIGGWVAALESGLGAEGAHLHALCCIASGAGTGAQEARDSAFLAQAYRVELGPLPREHIQALVESLELPNAPPLLGDAAWQLTGGNPALLLEALRDWSRRASAAAAVDPGSVPLASEPLAAAARERVQRLHPHALGVAQVVALAGRRFDPALAAEVLELSELEVVRALQCMERMGVVWRVPRGALTVCTALVEPATGTLSQVLRRRYADLLARSQGLVQGPGAAGSEPGEEPWPAQALQQLTP